MIWFFYALLAALACTLATLAQKKAAYRESAIQLGSASAIGLAVCSLFFLPFTDFSFPIAYWFAIVAGGIIMGASFYLWVKAFKYLNASLASPLFNLGTIFAVILAVVFLGEKLNGFQIAGISLLIIGAYVLELKHKDPLSPIRELIKSEKVHYALFASLGYSVMAVLNTYALRAANTSTLILVQFWISALIIVFLTFYRHGGLNDIKQGFKKHWRLLYLIILANFLTEVFSNLAYKYGEASLALPIIRSWTLFVVILGGTYLREGHLKNRLIATGLMLIGIFVIYI